MRYSENKESAGFGYKMYPLERRSAEQAMKPDVFKHETYRAYIREVVEFLRARDRKYSLIYFSRGIGVSPAYLKFVLSGKRRLSPDLALTLAKRLRLSELESRYFLSLVMRDDADSAAVRRHFESALLELKKGALSYSADRRLASVFSNSLMWEIFSLIGVDGFSEDAGWIAGRLKRRRVSLELIRLSLLRLLEIGAVARKGGKLVAKDIVSKHSLDLRAVYSLALRRALDELGAGKADEESYFDSFCLILSDEEYLRIREILEDAKRKVAAVARRKGPKSRIAYYNSNLFFASR